MKLYELHNVNENECITLHRDKYILCERIFLYSEKSQEVYFIIKDTFLRKMLKINTGLLSYC